MKKTATLPGILGISHMGLYTKDMEKSLSFYQDFLGFEEAREWSSDPSRYIKINDRQYIELIPEPDSRTGRLVKTVLLVEDIEDARRYLTERGVGDVGAIEEDALGNRGFTVKDPEGHALGFVQYLPGGRVLSDTGRYLGKGRVSRRLKHAGFTVADLEAGLAFYRDILGGAVTWQGSADNRKISWINMKLPDTEEYLELMAIYEEPDARLRGILDHMSLDVEEIDPPVEELKKRAAAGLYDQEIESQKGLNNKWQVNLYDPDGTRAELMEPVEYNHRSPDWFLPE